MAGIPPAQMRFADPAIHPAWSNQIFGDPVRHVDLILSLETVA
jgi:hypothetical protein